MMPRALGVAVVGTVALAAASAALLLGPHKTELLAVDALPPRSEAVDAPMAEGVVQAPPPPAPQPDTDLTGADHLPAFTLCGEDREWQWPTRQEMEQTVWSDNRYRDPNAQMLEFHDARFLFFTTVTASGTHHAANLSGLWMNLVTHDGRSIQTARPQGVECSSGGTWSGRAMVLWAFGYALRDVTVEGDQATVILDRNAALNRGYSIARMAKPDGDPWLFRFVTLDGEEIEQVALSPRCTGAGPPRLTCARF